MSWLDQLSTVENAESIKLAWRSRNGSPWNFQYFQLPGRHRLSQGTLNTSTRENNNATTICLCMTPYIHGVPWSQPSNYHLCYLSESLDFDLSYWFLLKYEVTLQNKKLFVQGNIRQEEKGKKEVRRTYMQVFLASFGRSTCSKYLP